MTHDDYIRHISLMAAPIYVMLLAKETKPPSQDTVLRLADASLALARTLWLRTLDTDT